MMFYVSRCHFRDAPKRAEANQPPRKYITETLSASSIVNDTSRIWTRACDTPFGHT